MKHFFKWRTTYLLLRKTCFDSIINYILITCIFTYAYMYTYKFRFVKASLNFAQETETLVMTILMLPSGVSIP
jgi:hypothetical protein